MKRYPVLCLAALLTLSLSACGSTAGPSSASAASSAPAASQSQQPTVTLSKETGRFRSADGKTVLLSSEWNTASVSIPGNESAQAAVQSTWIRFWRPFKPSLRIPIRSSKTSARRGSPSAAPAAYHALNITRSRCDSAVISLVIDETSYTGGAHGSDYRYARNYDTATGQVLHLSDLGVGVSDVAGDSIVSFINQIHDKDGLFFRKVKQSDLRDLITDDLFYFDQNGLVFIAGQYSFQSYAEGIVEFTISYDDLNGALRDTYNPGGGVTQCATDLGIYTFRKDGSLDTSKAYDSENAAIESVS